MGLELEEHNWLAIALLVTCPSITCPCSGGDSCQAAVCYHCYQCRCKACRYDEFVAVVEVVHRG